MNGQRTLHVLVGRDEASSVGGGADSSEVQPSGVRRAAGGDEDGVELEGLLLLLGLRAMGGKVVVRVGPHQEKVQETGHSGGEGISPLWASERTGRG